MGLADGDDKVGERILLSKEYFRSISPGLMGHLFGDDHSMFFRGYVFNISKESINDYLEVRAKISRPLPTAVFVDGYFEQAIQAEGRSNSSILSRLGNEMGVEIVSNDGRISARVGPPSDRFVYANLDADGLDSDLRRLLVRDRGRARDAQRASCLGKIFLFHTISLKTNYGDGAYRDPQVMSEMAESVLFNIAYSKGIPVLLSKSWRREVYSLKLRDLPDISFPVRRYNPHLVAYYNLAIGSDSLVSSFLSLYKVMEYFFSESREAAVHEKLSNLLASPDFRHSSAKSLREIQKIVRKHDINMDEQTMLREVLSRYVGVEDIREWLSEYEMENGKVFTEKRTMFNEESRIDTSLSSIIANSARRIYHVRNALVHNKESDGARFVPFSGDEEVLVHEIPFAMFLAEKLIINTSKPI